MARLQSALFLYLILLIFPRPAVPLKTQVAQMQPGLSVDEMVERMQEHEAKQSRELRHYDALRHYEVQYKGLGRSMAAKMDVEISFDNLSGKSFRFVSQSGSKLLCDKVLKRAVDSEKEAANDKSSTALTSANYRFQLAGNERLDGRPTYILQVDPLKKSKFLYRGRVWVDAADYAVAKIEVEPAKSPSFWISSTKIESTNSKTDGIWLPARNRSESKIRIGGTAVLTIDYGTYHVVLVGQPGAVVSRSTEMRSTGAEAASD
jgi:hypothetical protein